MHRSEKANLMLVEMSSQVVRLVEYYSGEERFPQVEGSGMHHSEEATLIRKEEKSNLVVVLDEVRIEEAT